ncbi:glycosyltransferase [Photobacterium leiognathi]|uniref:glycosyltransferase n=1 Tax=Photobacterium leiognathi TaxID=553611 RepID=UPI002980C94C|nr:glycosyltransferase [Photobacterium leiognathi]
MRLAVFVNEFPVSSQTFVMNQVVGLLDLGIEVQIISLRKPTSQANHENIKKYNLMDKVIFLDDSNYKNKLSFLKKVVKNICTLICNGRIKDLISVVCDKHLSVKQKIILINFLSKRKIIDNNYTNIICHFGNFGYFTCKLRDLNIIKGPVSTIFHGYEVSRYDLVKKNLDVYRELFLNGDLMLPVSELWKSKLLEWGCKESKVTTHRMGIDLDEFKQTRRTRLRGEPLKIIQVGRLTEKKAILDSINAVVQASKTIPIQFNIIGDGELFTEAESLILSLKANEFIHLLGVQPQSFVKDQLNKADVFLLPSVRSSDGDMEGVPVALMEAMAIGLICLSTKHSGIPELIENDISGYLAEESNVEQLTQALIKIDGLPQEKIEKLRKNAREKCEIEFNNKKLNENLSRFFK